MTAITDRFWSNVDKTEDCWLWTRPVYGPGYARFWDGESQVLAHRWIYEQIVGPIPTGLTIDHLCRVRHCVNPAHMEPVTNRENIMRGEGITAVRARQTHCPNGHERSEANTYWRPNGTRYCRICHRIAAAAAKVDARGEVNR